MSSSATTIESSAARIDLPKGGRALSGFPNLQASAGKSRLLVIVDPDPALWIADVIRWDEPPGIDPFGQIETMVNRSRSISTPYLGRERVLEQTGPVINGVQYAAKLLMCEPASHRRVDFTVYGPGDLAVYDSHWSDCIRSFRFVGDARPLESLFPTPVTIDVDSACCDTAERLVSVSSADPDAVRWFTAAARVKGVPLIKSLLLRVQRTEELDEDVTRYTVGVVKGVESPCGGIRFYESVAEALSDSRQAYGVDLDAWTALEHGPEWASTVDDSIDSAMEAYTQGQQGKHNAR